MWPALLSLWLVTVVVGVFVYRRQVRSIRSLRQQREALKVEEKRVFDFLHGLGSAFSGDIRPTDLHRLIVEGAARILDAHGGALYLADRTGVGLVPTFISKGCPPLVPVPPHILQQADVTPVALDSYLRLHPVGANDGVLSDVWTRKEPVFLSRVSGTAEDSRLAALRETTTRTESALISPLVYSGQNLGVLALANGPMGRPFTATDFDIFKSIAEQSAFALYNAIVYSEYSEKKTMDRDLEVARDIQRILLPANAPDIKGFEIVGINIPARQVSGDYYDYIRIDEHHHGIVIADVSGKGVPASLIMAMCRSVLRSQAPNDPSAADVLRQVNRQLFPDMKEDMFISMCYVIIDHAAGEVSLARAGHDAPLLYSAKDAKVGRLNPPGMALGVDSGSVFDRLMRNANVPLNSGDCLILYTDGVTEALDTNGMEYGMEKLHLAIQASAPSGAAAVVKRLTDDLRAFIGNQLQNDDITLIVLRKL